MKEQKTQFVLFFLSKIYVVKVTKFAYVFASFVIDAWRSVQKFVCLVFSCWLWWAVQLHLPFRDKFLLRDFYLKWTFYLSSVRFFYDFYTVFFNDHIWMRYVFCFKAKNVQLVRFMQQSISNFFSVDSTSLVWCYTFFLVCWTLSGIVNNWWSV